MTKLTALHARIVRCRKCERLVEWREEVARVKRRAYRDETYWGKPVPGFGDPKARLVIVGLAPGAHGANRTGRIFTGDASGDFLYAALHRAGFANQPTSRRADDGLKLKDCFITCPVRCVPPDNKPTPEEIRTCRPYLREELSLLKPKVFLALGRLAWSATLDFLNWENPKPVFWVAPPAQPSAAVAQRSAGPSPLQFAHGAVIRQPGKAVFLAASFHVSQQNTQTGRLTAAMFDQVLGHLRSLLDAPRR